jgi:soluble lytic murein transglycosylase-like protein
MAETPQDAPQAANIAPAEVVEAEPETVEDMVRRIASEGGVNPDRAVAIAFCESRLDPSARNWQGSSATGLFQFIDSTWKYIGSPGDRLDAEDSARAFVEWYPGHESWWACHGLTE